MKSAQNTSSKSAVYKNFFITVYPILLIILIPGIMFFNTYWNLKSFNRDANFIVRHEAVSIADILKPQLENAKDLESSKNILAKITNTNEDILGITIFNKENGKLTKLTSVSKNGESIEMTSEQLNNLAVSFNEPFAALIYNPVLRRNVWNVVAPATFTDGRTYLINFQLDSKNVTEILQRTSKDSFVVLFILILIILALLANHFYFYLRSLRTKQLEEIDRLKDEFISMAAHELRAPITAITGYLDLLKDELVNKKTDNATEDIGILTSLTRDLNGLVEELLDVSRIEQGRIKVSKESTDVNEVIAKIVLVMTPSAKAKGLQLNFSKKELPAIVTDPDRIRQIVTNLVSNSVKYTLTGSVEVSTGVNGKNLEIVVKDTGIGIPGDEIPKLFQKFHRVQDKKTMEVRGTGLGLWITKQLIELLGGNIKVESIYGTGTSFIVVLPL